MHLVFFQEYGHVARRTKRTPSCAITPRPATHSTTDIITPHVFESPPLSARTPQNKVQECALANETETMSDSDEFEYDYDDQNSSDGGYEAMAEADESMTDARSKQAQVGSASLAKV